MSYFTEIEDYKTYVGKEDDFHFIYNANTGGGQSFLGGKFRDNNGNLVSPTMLNGLVGTFRFSVGGGLQKHHEVLLDDNSVCYEIKPRAVGDNNMKLSVGNKPTPSSTIAAFLMLPEPCGVKRSSDTTISVLNANNYWLQSMWLNVDTSIEGKAILTPRDCVICGGIDRQGQGSARYFSIDFAKRFADVINAAKNNELDGEVLSCVKHFADIYKGEKTFDYGESVVAIRAVMKHLASKYPEQYSGTLDPLSFILSRFPTLQGKPSTSLYSPAECVSETENDRRLDAAQKLFAEKRMEDGDGGWFKVGREVNGRIREYFDSLTKEAIEAFDDAKIEELFCGRKDADGKIELETMWSGKPGMGWANIKPKSAQETQAVRDFLCKLKSDPGVMATFRQSGFMRPAGFGPSVVSELLMKFHPEHCIKHGEVSHKVLTWLGLIDSTWSREYSDGDYKQVCGAAAKIVAKMSAMGIPRQIFADGTGDNTPPDYLTVNEFTWFVSENEDLIQEEIMKKQWKPVNSKEKIKRGTRKLSDAFASDEMLKRLAAALRTKPFAILAGHSGTGKSQLVRRLAYMTCNNELLAKEGEGKTAPGNYCMVQVKPNWHDSSDLLGYYSEMGGRHFVNTPFVQFVCKAYAYPDTPFFVCLDEMNLAPVEQYFAEYLSAIESLEKKGDNWLTDPLVEVDRDGEKADPEILGQIMKGAESTEAAAWIQSHGLTIPKNLFVIGTVNMDETTCQFSRKVLDRAMTLLMNTVSFADMATGRKPSEEKLLDDDGVKFFLEGDVRGGVGAIESGLLDGINEPLKNTAFVVAYRFANEYALYEAAWAKLRGIDLATAAEEDKKKLASEALDHVVLMKLLPRIHGERAAVKTIFEGGKRDGMETPGLKGRLPSGGLSAKMMDDILARGDEYLTFWP